MTQQEHLTTEQLSAYLDKQLTPQEQAFFDAHLQSCQRCRTELAELRRTVVLLHAMPQPELPRSFTLPVGITPIQARPSRPPLVALSQRRMTRNPVQRTIRVISTLAAVIGLIFIMSGILPNIHFGLAGGATTTSAPAYGNAQSSSGSTSVQQPRVATPNAAGTPTTPTKQTGTPTPAVTPTAKSEVKPASTGTSPPPSTLPPALDIGQPAGRLSLGALLLLLSIIGILMTRRRLSPELP